MQADAVRTSTLQAEASQTDVLRSGGGVQAGGMQAEQAGALRADTLIMLADAGATMPAGAMPDGAVQAGAVQNIDTNQGWCSTGWGDAERCYDAGRCDASWCDACWRGAERHCRLV